MTDTADKPDSPDPQPKPRLPRLRMPNIVWRPGILTAMLASTWVVFHALGEVTDPAHVVNVCGGFIIAVLGLGTTLAESPARPAQGEIVWRLGVLTALVGAAVVASIGIGIVGVGGHDDSVVAISNLFVTSAVALGNTIAESEAGPPKNTADVQIGLSADTKPLADAARHARE